MKSVYRAAAVALVALSMTGAAGPTVSAQEVPTGAARIIEKVQTRIFISKSSLLNEIAKITTNIEESYGSK